MRELYEDLLRYAKEDIYPMHMPGHKRNQKVLAMDPAGWDITEIDGFDNLQAPDGILWDVESRIRDLCGSAASFLCVNGSSGSLLTAMKMCGKHGDVFLMARNCHKSVYHGCTAFGLRPVYLYPEWREKDGISGEIRPETVERGLVEHPESTFVLITSPTYDGVVSDIRAIADICHAHGIPLVVDEAHGAHFPFHPAFPETAIRLGADLVVHSIHKTLPALTQTSALHLGAHAAELGITPAKMMECINLLQTSSPSYVLMASVAECYRVLAERGEELFEAYAARLREFYAGCQDLRRVRVLPAEKERDPGKILISLKGTDLTGREATVYMREKYRLETEMDSGDLVLALTSVADTDEGFRRLLEAVHGLDRDVRLTGRTDTSIRLPKAEPVIWPEEAWNVPEEARVFVPREKLLGEISLEFVYLYPPGIPILAPGERVTEAVLEVMDKAEAERQVLKGMERRGGLYVKKS
ncbi:MAG: aminotransferase class I/II-fold pyridoxal phosphate-dependent enzyme [Lachnospiraceae bacterium]|nr:aminotransferase class I/II-fold pyridoxal phosphate-dependent enzyme [Lachnospiraceae bacterium]